MGIEVQHISKSFGEFKALDDVSIKVNAGELVALLGPSGSGKTTLLRIIAGLEVPDRESGPIFFKGKNVARKKVGDRGVGFVFQHYALFRHMTVFDNIAFGLTVKPRTVRPTRDEIREKVQNLLHMIQLDNLANRYPSQLSGGQRQRVALARALAVEPEILLLDEPFGALDAKVRVELRSWLRRLHDEIHLTSVFVTHDQDEALELADRVAVMNNGKIEQFATPDDVFHNPATLFVMNFLGQVNQFRGRYRKGSVRIGQYEGSAEEMVSLNPALAPNDPAMIFVRPHDFEISHWGKEGRLSFPAKVLRVHSAGTRVRVDMETEASEPLFVEISHQERETLQIETGKTYYVTPRSVHVFDENAVSNVHAEVDA
ncbi:MAG: TOBE-like domain-containing protein [Planctomycetia bacterium]|nr:TOBE-like domain-containing protein [Planctomycetia bacterium]